MHTHFQDRLQKRVPVCIVWKVWLYDWPVWLISILEEWEKETLYLWSMIIIRQSHEGWKPYLFLPVCTLIWIKLLPFYFIFRIRTHS